MEHGRQFVGAVCLLVIALVTGRSSAYRDASVSSDLMLCRAIPRIFGSIDDDSSQSKGNLRGPEGFAGQRGRTGLPGPRGEPEYAKVSSIAKKKVEYLNARLTILEKELQELKANGATFVHGGSTIARTTQSPQDEENGKKCMDKYHAPIHIGSKCYVVMGSEGMSLTYEFAQSNCSKSGGSLADVNSRELYEKIYDYVDKTFSTVVTAWTGMEFKDDKAFLTTGKEANFTKWMAYYPKSSSTYSFYRSYTHVCLYIDTSARTIALQNTAKSRRFPLAVCHYDLDKATPTKSSTTTTTTEDPDYYDYYYGY